MGRLPKCPMLHRQDSEIQDLAPESQQSDSLSTEFRLTSETVAGLTLIIRNRGAFEPAHPKFSIFSAKSTESGRNPNTWP